MYQTADSVLCRVIKVIGTSHECALADQGVASIYCLSDANVNFFVASDAK